MIIQKTGGRGVCVWSGYLLHELSCELKIEKGFFQWLLEELSVRQK